MGEDITLEEILKINSIKTRIETPNSRFDKINCISLKINSIKTRIETLQLLIFVILQTLILKINSIKTRIET